MSQGHRCEKFTDFFVDKGGVDSPRFRKDSDLSKRMTFLNFVKWNVDSDKIFLTK